MVTSDDFNDLCLFIFVVLIIEIIKTLFSLSRISLLVCFLQVNSVHTANLILYCANAQDALLNEHVEHCISFPIDPTTPCIN